MVRAWLVVLAVSGVAARATAQAAASIGFGAGTVRSEGRAGFSTASISPSLRYSGAHFGMEASGIVASLPAGAWSSYGHLGLRSVTPRLTGGFRLAADGELEGTRRTGGLWTGAGHGIGEVVWSARSAGIALGAGPSSGWIFRQPSVTALHTRGRLWWYRRGDGGRTNAQLTVEPTRLYAAWFTDVTASLVREQGLATVSVWSATRVSKTYGSTEGGGAFVQLRLSRRVSLDVGGGASLRDPYQGLPRGGFFSIALRVHEPRLPVSLPPPPPSLRSVSPLVPVVRGDSLVLRFHFADAHSVTMAGDWNAWKPLPLRSAGRGVWEGALVLGKGLYHFNLLVDGTEWVVPSGVATVPDGLGGMVALLLVR